MTGGLAGCLSPPAPTIHLPRPTQGAEFVYDGPEQARLTVTVEDTGRRVDGHLQDHDVILFEWRYRRKAGNFTYTLWEAVDRSTGHIVQQVRRCVPYDFMRGGEPPRACWDERAVIHLAGSAGLPGAFGAGPLWNVTLETGTVAVPFPAQGATRGPSTIPYRVEPSDLGPDCLRLTSPANATRTRPLPQTVIEGPFVVCPERALPVAFETLHGDRFRLVDHEPGARTIEPGDPPDWTATDPVVPRRTWSDPVAVDPTDGDPYNFSFQEAHEWALDNNDQYVEILEDPPKGLTLWSLARQGGGGTNAGGVVQVTSGIRTLLALQPDGNGTLLTLRQEQQSPDLPADSEPIRVVEQENFTRGEPIPTRDSLVDKVADANGTVILARTVTGQPISGVGPYQVTSLRYPKGDPRGVNGPWREDGVTVVAWMAEEPPFPGGGLVEAPYPFVVDGPTGAVEFLEMNRTRLPVRQWI